MNGKQLKNSILQWAIQGKLVPQDPNDEPASVLLERIRAERKRLIKEGKIKKDKNESIIYRGDDNSYYEKFADGRVVCIDDEIPFEIPQSWEWTRLKNMFSLQAGKNITSSEIKSSVDDLFKYPCFGGNGLRGYVRRYNNEGIKPLIGRQGALCGNLNMSYGQFYATEHAVVVDSFGDEINVDWSYYFLTALNLNQYATATAQPGLAVSKIIECLIPVPPRSEQIRIVAKIRLLIPCLDRFQYAQDKLETLNEDINNRLKKSILQEAIQGHLTPQVPSDEPVSVLLYRIQEEKKRLLKDGKIKQRDLVESVIYKAEDNKYYENVGGRATDISEEIPFDIPKSWAWCRLGSVIMLQSGQDLVPERYFTTPNGIPYITGASNLANGAVLVNRWTNTPTSISHKGDLLITCKGTVGTMAYNTIGDIHIARQIMSIHSDWILIEYIEKYLEYSIPKLEKAAHSIIPGISRETILTMLIPIPPIEEQGRILGRLRDIHKN